MTTRFRVWLDGQGLHDLDDTLIITDVKELPAQEDLHTVPGLTTGARLVRRVRRSLSVQIRFMVRQRDPVLRKAVMEAVRAWAGGRVLTLSDRPCQQLQVVCDHLPMAASALKWTEECTLTLTAYALPYWQSETPSTLTTSSSGEIPIPGNGPCTPVDVTLTPHNSLVTLAADICRITLEDVAVGTPVTLGHNDDGRLFIRQGERSLLASRTADSADDLLVVPGKRCIFSVSGGTATFSARGVWL